ncbi:MAG: esterase family protein [Lachnospiraceae bacterium]|nr:esterase family protein [Lachnospiraceae bacterium]
MRRILKKSLCIAMIMTCGVLCMAGCGNKNEGEAEPTKAAETTPTPEPTAIPEPTATPEPTAIPEPTATPKPTATPAPVYAENAWFDNGKGADMEEAANKVEVKAPAAYLYKKADVTYGEIITTKYYSATCGREKNVIIALPGNYSEEKTYPVCYVLHGVGGSEKDMIGNGSSGARVIAANLAAKGEAEEMILVFPNMYSSATQAGFTGIDHENMAAYDNFVNDLVNDLMPFIADNYSVATGRENTAVVGFSMGGRESLCIGFSRPDLFGYVGAIAPAPGLTPGKDMFLDHIGTFKEEELVFENESPEILMICSGDKDNVVGKFPLSYHNILNTNGVNHIWWEIPGSDHGDPAISSGLYNFCKSIFKKEQQ